MGFGFDAETRFISNKKKLFPPALGLNKVNKLWSNRLLYYCKLYGMEEGFMNNNYQNNEPANKDNVNSLL